MKRRVVVVDRVSCVIVGGGLVALGMTAVAWERGALTASSGNAIHVPVHVVDSVWWPVVLSVAATVLIVTGLRWLFSHRPRQTLGSTTLPGSGVHGRLSVDVNTVATAAAADVARYPQIAAAKGTTRVDRGQRLIEFVVKIDPAVDNLDVLAPAVHDLHEGLAEALDGVPHTSRVVLRMTSARRAGRNRVH